MRYREPFTVFPRKMKSGLVVWYYQTYDTKGRRTTARSTGQKTKGAARAYCIKLYKANALISNKNGSITFGKYAENWWIWNQCEYIKYRNSRRRPLSRNYVNSGRINLKKHILPYFEKMKLDSINNYDIERWLSTFEKKGLSNLTANMNLVFLSIMLADAVRRELLSTNPADNVAPLRKDGKERDILSTEEVQKIFAYESIEILWKKRVYYLANLLSACTGLRVSEILALRNEVLFDGYIMVSDQYHPKYGLIPTKTHDTRQIPIPKELQKELEALSLKNGGKYLFSINGGENPVCAQSFNNALKYALKEIGISEDEQEKRQLCFHGWRHFFNTTMRTNNISDGKLQKLTGHKSQNMTEHYTHFKAEDFNDVAQVQAKIIQMPRKAG